MKPTTPAAPADPVLLLIAAGWLAAEALLPLFVAALALLLTLAGWRPAAARLVPTPSTPASVDLPPFAPAPLERLTVAQLRTRARAAGLPRLARCGRRAQLLEALAAAPVAPSLPAPADGTDGVLRYPIGWPRRSDRPTLPVTDGSHCRH